MTSQQKVMLGIIGLVIIAGLLWWKNQQSEVSDTSEAIKIGSIQPLSGDGAVWGFPQKNGIELAVAEINSQGGIKGRPIKVTFEDGKCDAKESVAAANKLIDEGVKIIFTSCGTETLAIAPITERNHVILFTPYASHPDIAGAGQYIFRNSYSDSDVGRSAADTISKQYKRVGMLYEVTDYTVGVKNAFKGYFEKQGGQVIEEGYPHNSKDMRTQITKLLGQNVEAIFVNPDSPATGVVALQQLRSQGFKGQLYSNYSGDSDEIVRSPAAEGMIFFADSVIKDSSAKKDFLDQYQKQYGTLPDLEYPAVASYDGIKIFKQALEKVGYDPEKLKDYLYNMADFTGILGIYRFDNTGDVAGIMPSVKQIKNGQVVVIQN